MTKNDWPNNCVRKWSARKPCEISYLSFLSFRCDLARECFCEIRTWIPGGVLRYISDGDVRGPFLGLKFAI